MPKVKISRDRCKGCQLCVLYCPKGALVTDEHLNKRGVKPALFKKGADCIGCTFCAIICPDMSVEVFK